MEIEYCENKNHSFESDNVSFFSMINLYRTKEVKFRRRTPLLEKDNPNEKFYNFFK